MQDQQMSVMKLGKLLGHSASALADTDVNEIESESMRLSIIFTI
jgi:hypothetical protein